MPNDSSAKPVMTGWKVTGYKGADSDKSFDSAADVQRKKDQAAFDTEMGWSGLGGASKRPKQPEYDKQFSDWQMKKAKKKGQSEALK